MDANRDMFTRRYERSYFLCPKEIVCSMSVYNGEFSLLVTLMSNFPAGSDLVLIRKRRLAGAGI